MSAYEFSTALRRYALHLDYYLGVEVSQAEFILTGAGMLVALISIAISMAMAAMAFWQRKNLVVVIIYCAKNLTNFIMEIVGLAKLKNQFPTSGSIPGIDFKNIVSWKKPKIITI